MKLSLLVSALICSNEALVTSFRPLMHGRVVTSSAKSSSSSSGSTSRHDSSSSSSSSNSIYCYHANPRQLTQLSMAPSSSSSSPSSVIYPDPSPGAPVLKKVDKEKNIAYMSICISGPNTQKAFAQSCELFNEEVKTRGYKVAGFRQGAKLPPAYLYQMFGEDRVKMLCGNLLSVEIQDECEKTGLMFVGRGRITNFNEGSFQAGKPHVIEIECDLWPEITYSGEKGYKGLEVTVTANPIDKEKFEQVKRNIRERYKELGPTPDGYEAVMGDVVIADMSGFETEADGSRGAPLPSIAGGQSVEIFLEKGKFMEGMVESLVGAKAGEVRQTMVTFPVRDRGPGAALSGKKAVFDVTVKEVKSRIVPEWNEALAARVRDGMTLAELEKEVRTAIEGDAKGSRENIRNDALAAALLQITNLSQIPESLVEENTQSRFQEMLMDFKDQGSTEEQMQEMATPESYAKYKEISRPNVNKIVKLGMAFRDIAEKEGISVSASEVREQLDVLNVQAKQKGEQPPDEARAKDEIENVLLRRKVFDMLASHAQITWIEQDESA